MGISWDQGEPNGGTRENCAFLYWVAESDHMWNHECDNLFGGLCEGVSTSPCVGSACIAFCQEGEYAQGDICLPCQVGFTSAGGADRCTFSKCPTNHQKRISLKGVSCVPCLEGEVLSEVTGVCEPVTIAAPSPTVAEVEVVATTVTEPTDTETETTAIPSEAEL